MTIQSFDAYTLYPPYAGWNRLAIRLIKEMLMLNNDLKKEAIEKLNDAIANNEEKIKEVETKSSELFEIRQKSVGIIQSAENFIKKLANTPKEFDKTFSVFKAEYKAFTDTMKKAKKAYEDVRSESVNTSTCVVASKSTCVATGVGVTTGVGVATLGPTAAMAIATTFGTASTGTAIASLSGAAATNATLALLGGGALSVGGGGMVAGSRILALFGPVGIGISAVTLIGGGFYASWKNEEIAKEADKEREPVEKKSAELEIPIVEIHRLIDLTDEHQNGVSEILLTLKSNAPNDYQDYSSTQKNFLASLINHVQSLSKLLNKKVQ